MLELGKRLNNTTESQKELLPYLKITKTTYEDIWEILRILVQCFKIPSKLEAYKYLYEHKVNMLNSVKLIDTRTNEVYGLLLLGEAKVSKMLPLTHQNPLLHKILNEFKQLNGIAFIIDERLRGCLFDKKMLYHNIDYIKNFNIVWCGVDTNLNTHKYWKRLGFFEIIDLPFAKFYAKFV